MKELDQVDPFGLDREFLVRRSLVRTVIPLLVFLALSGTALVTGLFLISEEIVHRRNDFTRRYLHHPSKRIIELDLDSNSYYPAGAGAGKFPHIPISQSHYGLTYTRLMDTKQIPIQFSDKKKSGEEVRIHLLHPNLYVWGDPKGAPKNWTVGMTLYGHKKK